MKQIILYGPGSMPHILVSDDEAEIIKDKFHKGESFEVKQPQSILLVRENMCWAIKIEEFSDRRHP